MGSHLAVQGESGVANDGNNTIRRRKVYAGATRACVARTWNCGAVADLCGMLHGVFFFFGNFSAAHFHFQCAASHN